jgi:peptidoglycan/xylan/chitin deacetylase (PgdA/CDA1 family)
MPKKIARAVFLLFFLTLLLWFSNTRLHWLPRVEANLSREHAEVSGMPVYYHDQVAVLMYHHVSPGVEREGCITPRRFDQELGLLKQNGFNFIPVEQLAAFTEGEADVPPNAVVVTFDDGYEDVYLYAYPVLKRHRIPGVAFVIGGKAGEQGYLSWNQVRSMEKSGLVTIGGHTFNQHRRVHVSPRQKKPASVGCIYDSQSGSCETREQYLERMSEDCRLLREIFMSELGHGTAYYAYPYGAYSQDFSYVLQEHGYKYLFTVCSGVNTRRQNPLRYHRINAGTPRVPTEKLLARLKNIDVWAAVSSEQPADWSPVWEHKHDEV